ncbi:MAG: DNA repair protein RecN [Chthoniobacterales bacterium]
MLSSLRIRNFALVESLAWDVPAGFVAITGETGAGKSILIGGLKLLLGERADKSAIRSGEAECVIEAIVELPAASPVPALLKNAAIEPCEDNQLLLKRVISATGAGRQFVNGSPTTLARLREIGDHLVDLHGPHDHQSLFSREAQTRLVDAFAGSEDAADTYRASRRRWLTLETEQAESESDVQAVEREIDLLNHQVSEIDAAELLPDEEEPLLARAQAAGNAERLLTLAAEAEHALAGEETSIENGLINVGRLAREIAKLDPTGAESLADRVTALADETSDLAGDFSRYRDRIDADPESLAATEARLDLIEDLKRKYGRTLQDVIAFADEARDRLAALRTRSERRANLGTEISTAREATLKAGGKLSKLRFKAAPKLAAEARQHLQDLGFLKAGFEVQLASTDEPTADGLETVEFVFAPNPGEPAQPLRAIASSGEISRVMLALKTSLAAQDEVPVLVFDEIDANVGGEIAHAVASKMAEIGESRQVLCITHLPQVAANADRHFVVAKSVVDGRTISVLDPVDGAAREAEVARMLGSRQGGAALAHARELLQ